MGGKCNVIGNRGKVIANIHFVFVVACIIISQFLFEVVQRVLVWNKEDIWVYKVGWVGVECSSNALGNNYIVVIYR